MDSERYEVVWVDDHGFGIVREKHTHYVVVEFVHEGHSWRLIVDNEDYEPAHEITLGHEEIE